MTEVLLDDLLFGEGPRWHDGRLWFSDFFRHEVRAVTPGGEAERIASVPNQPSGLGWLPDGRLLVVSMIDRKVLRLESSGELVDHADLSSLADGDCNDMVVDATGRAYVGNFGPTDDAGTYLPTGLVLVHPDGGAEVVADDLAFPNGAVITPDGSTLIIGETFGERLTAFTIDPGTGHLSERRVWAALPGVHPDGCCLDRAGGMWVADPPTRACLRVVEGGKVTDRVETRYPAIACTLGGEDGRTLFVCTSAWADASVRSSDDDPFALVEHTRVDHPHAGRP